MNIERVERYYVRRTSDWYAKPEHIERLRVLFSFFFANVKSRPSTGKGVSATIQDQASIETPGCSGRVSFSTNRKRFDAFPSPLPDIFSFFFFFPPGVSNKHRENRVCRLREDEPTTEDIGRVDAAREIEGQRLVTFRRLVDSGGVKTLARPIAFIDHRVWPTDGNNR